MALEKIHANCDHCRNRFVAMPTRTFLGFQRLTCPKCSGRTIYPLTTGFRITYWILAALMLLFIANAFDSGGYAYPGGVGLAVFFAIYKDWRLRAKVQDIDVVNADSSKAEPHTISLAAAGVLFVGIVAAILILTINKNPAQDVVSETLLSLPRPSNEGEQVASLQTATAEQASPETQRTPDSEEGIWHCTGSSNQLVKLFLFPKSTVYMSAEPDKWTLMPDLIWRSPSDVSNQSGNYLTVNLLTNTQASITWPAGESTSCTRESVQTLPTPRSSSSNPSPPTYSVPQPPPGFVLDDPTAAGATDVAGWTQESTQSTEAGPWLAHSPAGTRYFRDKDGIIHRVFPPNVRPDAASADATIVANSTITFP